MLNPDLSLPLPYLPSLGVEASQLPTDQAVAKDIVISWFKSFTKLWEAGNVQAMADLFHKDGYWRDMLTLTWDFRTFAGQDRVREFLLERVRDIKVENFKEIYPDYTGFQKPSDDLYWIQTCFNFEVGGYAVSNAVLRLVPVPGKDGKLEWKAHCIYTNLEGLKDHPELTGHNRMGDGQQGHKWLDQRRREMEAKEEPTVLIAGAAQSGLEVAARLKYLGVNVLVIEKEDRLGGNWRKRYEALCLHDPVWYDHMPYLPFPSTWPAFTPALKMANWLETYAETLEIPIWLSTKLVHAEFNEQTQQWDVTTEKKGPNGSTTRVFHPKHFVMATGLLGGAPKMPKFPGVESFKGKIMHSLEHKRADAFPTEKVAVIGSCTSAHDICADFASQGSDVTMIQRGSTYVMGAKSGLQVMLKGMYEEDGPPIEFSDLVSNSYPNLMIAQMGPRRTAKIAELDKKILDGLTKVGFKMNKGYMDCGPTLTGWEKAGGYYLDVGASSMIIDGKIKLKNDSGIKEFVPEGIKFEDGSVLEADLIIFATGFGGYRDYLSTIFSEKQMPQVKGAWGLDLEGELKGCYRDMGLPGLWVMMGNLALCRIHSKHLALQIKAQLEGLFDGKRYAGIPAPEIAGNPAPFS